jgi:hypothetical protein
VFALAASFFYYKVSVRLFGTFADGSRKKDFQTLFWRMICGNHGQAPWFHCGISIKMQWIPRTYISRPGEQRIYLSDWYRGGIRAQLNRHIEIRLGFSWEGERTQHKILRGRYFYLFSILRKSPGLREFRGGCSVWKISAGAGRLAGCNGRCGKFKRGHWRRKVQTSKCTWGCHYNGHKQAPLPPQHSIYFCRWRCVAVYSSSSAW